MCLMSKEIRINVRTKSEIKSDLEVTAELRGLTVSALVNSLVVKAIREEKERDIRAFLDLKERMSADQSKPVEDSKDVIKQTYIGGEVKKMPAPTNDAKLLTKRPKFPELQDADKIKTLSKKKSG